MKSLKLKDILFSFACLAASSAVAEASPYPLATILKQPAVEKLAKEKITTTDELLSRGALAKDRRKLAKVTGIRGSLLRNWVRMCDLLRIKGVGPEMVQLLKAGRIVTVKQLRAQKAGLLFRRLMRTNNSKQISKNPPSEEQLKAWIAEAKKLDLVLR